MIETQKAAKIVVVDDDPGVLKAFEVILKDQGYQVFAFTSAPPAFEKIKAEKMDLVVTDLKMAEMNGIELLYQIRERNPHLPVIILTGFATVESANAAVRLGAFDYIRKPCDVKQVLEVIRRALAKPAK